MKWAVLLAFLTFPVQAGESDEFLTTHLRAKCTSSDRPTQDYCGLFLFGLFQGLALGDEMKKHGGICPPDNVTVEELRLIYNRISEEDIATFPGDVKLPAASLAAAVLQRAFPCPAK